jgi:hypothetical protein
MHQIEMRQCEKLSEDWHRNFRVQTPIFLEEQRKAIDCIGGISTDLNSTQSRKNVKKARAKTKMDV